MADTILIIDFGSQVTQLIARRLRETGVYTEILPCTTAPHNIAAAAPKGIILSGGPNSVALADTPRAPQIVFDLSVPIFGICYGQQTMCAQLGGRVEPGTTREFGRSELEIKERSVLFDGVWSQQSRYIVWMSHGDHVAALPDGFRVLATSAGAPYAVVEDAARRYYGVQFHPEVVHTEGGSDLLRKFALCICGCSGNWSMAAYRQRAIAAIRDQVGEARVICGLSGGVDSSVAAVLIHEAIGDQLTCVFVDHGLLRAGEAEEVVRLFGDHYNIPLVHVDASDMFLDRLAGISDPEQKRKIIGASFIEVFDAEASKIADAKFLAQGTLYPDVIESVSAVGGNAVTIKSHHNVGGLPNDIEPEVHDLGDAFVYTLDDLEQVAQQGRMQREAVAREAWAIVDAEVARWTAGQAVREATPAVVALRAHFENLRQDVLTEQPHVSADEATRLLINRLLHAPTVVLRELATQGDMKQTTDALVRRLFALGENDTTEKEE